MKSIPRNPNRQRGRIRWLVLLAAIVAFAGCWSEPFVIVQPPVTLPLSAEFETERPLVSEVASLPLKYKDYNLVFVSFDALQAKHVGAYGNSRNVSPTLDSLAASGIRFANMHSVASWTVPASMTWFTGVYPSEHRMTNKFAIYNTNEKKLANLRDLAPDLVTLADVLQDNGYATGGFTGNAGVSSGFGYQQGFDVYYHEPGAFGRFESSVPKALEWVAAHREQKFFLFLHGYDVHGQSLPPEGLDFRFVAADYDRKYLGSPREQALLREEGLDLGAIEMRDADVQFWRAVYDEKIQRADAKFRDFLAAFAKLGLLSKTIFIITSDHGTEIYEHRRFDHGFTLYQELIHVPLIIVLPERLPPQVIDDRVSSIDVMPTILDLLDVPLADEVRLQLRGQSLVPALRGESVARDVYSETDYREYTFKRTLITPEGWKLIYTLESRARELFDLTNDPGETKNLAEAESTRADQMQEQLFEHYRNLGHDLKERQWQPGMNPVYDLTSPSSAEKRPE